MKPFQPASPPRASSFGAATVLTDGPFDKLGWHSEVLFLHDAASFMRCVVLKFRFKVIAFPI
jgi:hypothetical protein